jgi:hypothetical protein
MASGLAEPCLALELAAAIEAGGLGVYQLKRMRGRHLDRLVVHAAGSRTGHGAPQ